MSKVVLVNTDLSNVYSRMSKKMAIIYYNCIVLSTSFNGVHFVHFITLVISTLSFRNNLLIDVLIVLIYLMFYGYTTSTSP